ncbi:MAG: hypothetical protein IJL25_03220 [Clostridia bacterium]|nr:hypothetical protein [Clostridia bacterium]
MFAIKTRARYLTHGVKTKAALFSLLPKAACAGCVSSLLMCVLCAVYGADTVFSDTPVSRWFQSEIAVNAAPWAFVFAAVLFLLFHRSLRFALLALYYRCADKNQPRAGAFISLRSGVRALSCDLRLGLMKCGWAALLLLPAAATGASLFFLLQKGLPASLLAAGIALCALQTLSGLIAAYCVNRRYCLTRYLLYLNPLMRVNDAVSSGVLLTRGKRGLAALCGMSALPWKALGMLLPARPFCRAYVSLLETVLCETVYAEDKTKVNAPAVTFYIGKNTKISEKKAEI